MGLARTCAARFVGKGIEYDDLYQAACEGLVKAARAFDPQRGTRFSTYAVPVILGEIKDLFRRNGALKVSRRLRDLSLQAAEAAKRLQQEKGREPTVAEISAAVGCGAEEIAEAICSSGPVVSLSAPDDGSDLEVPTASLEDLVVQRMDIIKALDSLDSGQRRIFELRFLNHRSQAEVAKLIGTSQVTVSRREKRIRELLAGKLFP